ncbi:MAG: response regulator [Deltaproteobacteria bacterium]|nr:response regulator [Deltaproteobacteria bacterium]
MSAPPAARILVVDDAVFMRRQLREILEGAGYAVVAEGEDGAEALDLYETYEPDLVTLDVVMPRVTGLEALRKLKALHPEARVVVCSSLSHEAALLEAIGLGARDYVLKPVVPAKLLDAVAKALR